MTKAPEPRACPHRNPVEVRGIVTGELVAHLCPDCDTQLPADFDPDAYPAIGFRRGGY